jgi:acyl-CoA synthetase (AMP-forming)/AMP-acid ligase II
MLTADLIRRGARRWGDRIAISEGARSLTFTQTDRLANRLANTLIALGAAPQTLVAQLLNNSLYSIPLNFACAKARLNQLPLNARLSAAEQARMLAETNTQILIYGPDLAPRAAELRASHGAELRCYCLGESDTGDPDLLRLSNRAAETDPHLPTAPEDLLVTMFTSGTTGTLKAAQHTHASWAAICANVLANVTIPAPGDVMLHAASLIHASGCFVLPFWLHGGRAAVLPGFDPNSYLDHLVAAGATHINLVPTMLAMLLNDERRAAQPIGRLDTVIYGASPMPRPIIERGLAAWGPKFVQYYGQTEAPLAIASLPKSDHIGPDANLGAAGQPSVDVDLQLVDEAGNQVPDGEVGEIAVRGPIVHAGYRNAPALNAAVALPGGFIRTRDLGRFDDRGFLHLIDRTSDMIITGGYNVYPREVEDALAAHPAILECAVVGAPDATWVEAVTAFIVLKDGASIEDAALAGFLRERLAGYKVPKRFERIDVLPKSAVGKILRRALRERLKVPA